MTIKTFDFTTRPPEQQAALKIWGIAQICVPKPLNNNGIWRTSK